MTHHSSDIEITVDNILELRGIDPIRALNWNDIEDPIDASVWARANSNHWLPERVPIANDIPYFETLTPIERLTYARVLVGLTYLDTVQAERGLPSMQADFEDPNDVGTQHESHVLKQFEYMEAVHTKSYSSIFTTLLTTMEVNAAFQWSHGNKYLQYKGYLTMDRYAGGCPMKRRQASVFLEMFSFYSGFFYPLLLNDTHRITNSADIIKLIARDENVHGFYIGYGYRKRLERYDADYQAELKDHAYDLLLKLFENEIEYARDLYDPLGLTDQVITYMQYNADRALITLGYETLFGTPAADINPIILKALDNGENHDFFSGVGHQYTLMPTTGANKDLLKQLLETVS